MNQIICFKPPALHVVAPDPGALRVPQPTPFRLDDVSLPGTRIVLVAERGARGEPGPAGESAKISKDPGNQLKTGSDAGLLVPELDGADYLALYYLARG